MADKTSQKKRKRTQEQSARRLVIQTLRDIEIRLEDDISQPEVKSAFDLRSDTDMHPLDTSTQNSAKKKFHRSEVCGDMTRAPVDYFDNWEDFKFDATLHSDIPSESFGPSLSEHDSEFACWSDEEEAVHTQDTHLKEELAEWATACNIPLTSVTKLLRILHSHGLDVPLQATSLLRTPRNISVQRKSGGDFIYLGLKRGIKMALLQSPLSGSDVNLIELSVNIDGLPLFKSNKTTLWPIQCSIVNMACRKPFVVALYCADTKPTNLDFMDDFVSELKELMDEGIILNDGEDKKPVTLRCFVCDAPARALIKGTVQYNGRYGCDFCDVQGISMARRMVFLHQGNQRTANSFQQRSNPGHHKDNTPLLKLDMDIISQIPVDPMHCVDLGVVRKLIRCWKEGTFRNKLSSGQINLLSTYLKALGPFMPSEFNRKPRALQEYSMWKATEFRSFLMYTGPVILKCVLPTTTYKHFMSLSVAVCILYNEELVKKHICYARELLQYFVQEAKTIYGEEFLTYNVHCLLHLADFAENFKCLQNILAYEFENNMSSIKRSVRGPEKPIVQVCRRLIEKEEAGVKQQASQSEKRSSAKIGACYRMKNRHYATIHDVMPSTQQVLCEVYKRTASFYSVPCDSRILGIHKVSKRNSDMMFCSIEDLESPAICIPLSLLDKDAGDTAVVVPLMHSV